MDKITLYKIENKFGNDKYLVSADPVPNGEPLASYNNIEELYPTVITNDFTVQNYVATETMSIAEAGQNFMATRAAVGALNSTYQSGEGNSQYGTQWIYSEKEKRSKKIRITDDIPKGWKKGRKIKFEDNNNNE